MLVTSIFSFSRNVFKRFLFQGSDPVCVVRFKCEANFVQDLFFEIVENKLGGEVKIFYLLVFSQISKYFKSSLIIRFNSLPNDKILAFIKLKGFADKKLEVVKTMISVFDRVGNILGKDYQHFLLFPQCFQKLYCPGL